MQTEDRQWINPNWQFQYCYQGYCIGDHSKSLTLSTTTHIDAGGVIEPQISKVWQAQVKIKIENIVSERSLSFGIFQHLPGRSAQQNKNGIIMSFASGKGHFLSCSYFQNDCIEGNPRKIRKSYDFPLKNNSLIVMTYRAKDYSGEGELLIQADGKYAVTLQAPGFHCSKNFFVHMHNTSIGNKVRLL